MAASIAIAILVILVFSSSAIVELIQRKRHDKAGDSIIKEPWVEIHQIPGYRDARKVAEDYQARQKAKERKALKKWLAAQEKRVAKAKAKRARKEAWDRRTKEAWENTHRTWSGSGWNGLPLTPARGSITGPSGKETYYNLNMSVCVSIMRGMGLGVLHHDLLRTGNRGGYRRFCQPQSNTA